LWYILPSTFYAQTKPKYLPSIASHAFENELVTRSENTHLALHSLDTKIAIFIHRYYYLAGSIKDV